MIRGKGENGGLNTVMLLSIQTGRGEEKKKPP